MSGLMIVSDRPSISWVKPILIEPRFDCKFYSKDYLFCLMQISKHNHDKLKNFVIDKRSEPPIHSSMYGKKENNDIPIIRFADFTDFQYSIENCLYLKKEFINEDKIKVFLLKPGTVVYGLVGDVGHAFIVPESMPAALTYRRVAQLELEKIDPYYATVFLNTNSAKIQFDALSTGVNQAQLRLEDSIEVLIPTPSSEIQKYIGDKLRKAERLREEANRLKKEAYDTLDSFLDLTSLEEAIKKKKTNKYKWINSNHIENRLDSEYYKEIYSIIFNYLKNFSKKCLSLKNITSNIYTGKKPKPVNEGTEVFFVQSGDFSSDNLELKRKVLVCLRDYKPLEYNDLLFAKDGETIGKIAINLSNDAVIINEHTYCLRLKQNYKHYSAYIYYLLTNPIVNILIRREATGSAQKGLGQELFNNIFIPLIDEEVINNLYNIERKRYTNIAQINDLIQEAKKDVEDLIEGKFDYSKVQATVPESR